MCGLIRKEGVAELPEMFMTLFHFKRPRHVRMHTRKSAVPRVSLLSPDCHSRPTGTTQEAGYGACWYQVLFELLLTKQL